MENQGYLVQNQNNIQQPYLIIQPSFPQSQGNSAQNQVFLV